MNRRHFLFSGLKYTAGLTIASAIPANLLASLSSRTNLNSKIGIGLIGCKGMGWSNLMSMLKLPDASCIAICDVDENVLRQRKEELDKINEKPLLYSDYRKMLENRDVDVVIIATPDHWHCLMATDACAAGKDVFLEKPAANSIHESRAIEASARRYNRVVQVNQWQRSQQHFKDAMAFVHSGKLGTVAHTRAWMYNAHGPLAPVANAPVPAGVNYAAWLGPAPNRSFNPNRFHYNFRWYWDYAGGLMTDWGVHLIDMVLMGMKATFPQKIVSFGGHLAYPTDARETPDTQTALYDFGNFQLSWEHTMGRTYGPHGMGHGISFTGTNGTLLLNRGGWEVKPEMEQGKPRMEAIARQERQDNGLDLHTANFIDVVKSRNLSQLNCPIEAGSLVSMVSHMGNVALRTGQQLHWDAGKGSFGLADADALLAPEYHNGWKMPGL
jgi:predicted dehydrogenase